MPSLENTSDSFESNMTGNKCIMSTEHRSFTDWSWEYCLFVFMLVTFSLVGTLGNIPVLIVYLKRKESITANTFIKILACVDLNVCAIVIPYTILYELHLVFSDFFCKSLEFLRHFAIVASNITLVAIASERYIAVCRISRRLSVRNVNHGMYVIVIASVTIAAPSVGMFAVEDTDVNDVPCRFVHSYIHGKFCHFTYSILSPIGVKMYHGIQISLFFLAFVIIVVCYAIVYFTLWKKVKLRQKMLINSISSSSDPKSSSAEVIQRRICKHADDMLENQTTGLLQEDNEVDSLKTEDTCHAEKPNVAVKIDERKILTKIPEQSTKRTLSVDSSRVLKLTPTIKCRKLSISGHSVTVKRRKRFQRKNAMMLFLCSVIYLITWLPFWFDIFGFTRSILLRYLFFLGNASNPIVYGIVNERLRSDFKRLLRECRRNWLPEKDSAHR